jgi:hypothetical protein
MNAILEMLAIDLQLDVDELKSYAAEDNIGGWEEGKGSDNPWPIGSIHPVEGQIIYALIRAMRPDVVVEFGVAAGCSSKHILKALVKNRKGKLFSYDPVAAPLVKRFTDAENKRWKLVRMRGEDAILPAAEIVVEDTDHTIESTSALCEAALNCEPRLILAHDAEHFLVGEAVKAGMLDAGLSPLKTFTPNGSACGYGYWVNDN